MSAQGVRQVLVALNGGELVLSDSGGQHVEGVVDGLTDARVVHHGSLLKIQSRGATSVRLAIPAGVDLTVRGRRCEVICRVPLGNAQIVTGAGDVHLEGPVAGLLQVMSNAGDIDVAECGTQTQLRSGSGEVTIGTVTGQIEVRSGSGDITVASNRGQAILESGSGNIAVGIPEDVPTYLDLKSWSGSVDVSLPERDAPADDDPARVEAITASGHIRIAQS